MSDIVITPASGLIDFSNNSGISSATIQLDGSGNLNISAAAGDIQLGDTSTDIFIGDGVSNVDIVFEQDGEIRGLTGKTITLGQSDSFISFAGDITGDVTFDGNLRLNGAVYDNNNVVGAANSILTSTGSGVVWADAGNVVGVATDSDKLDGLDSTQFLRSDTADTAAGAITFDGGLIMGSAQVITHNSTQTRDKIRVWDSGNYAIGMDNSFTFGALNNDFAMTFQMLDTTNNRGWWWGDTNHSDAQGAMSLSTQGKLTLAHSIRLGYGESDTTVPGATHRLDVSGSGYISGNLGIGSDNPAHTLDVEGDAGFGGAVVWDGTLSAFDPPGGGTGTDTSTTVAVALGTGQRIAGWYDGYIRTLLLWNQSSDIQIGQSGTSLITGINLLPGSSGDAKVNGDRILTVTDTFGGDVSGTYDAIVVANDSHTHAFDNLTNKGTGTGNYSTDGIIESGRGSGGVALTINDGYGNANVTFNHVNGTPEQNGKAGRIEVNTDSTTGDATMSFELGDATSGVAFQTTSILQLSSGTSTWYGGQGLTFNNIPAFNGGTSGSSSPFTVDSTQVVTNLNADLLDGIEGANFLRSDTADTAAGAITFNGGLILGGSQIITHNNTESRDKIRVWNSNLYTIGFKNGYTFGALNNDYAMSFQMNDDADRGWWWGHSNHTDAQGAMSLNTDGKLSVAHSLRLGYGESDTTVPGATYTLDVSDNVSIASTVSIGSTIDIIPYNDLGTLSFEGSAGQLFSITNNLTSGSIFSVNDVSGIPSIDVDADGTIQLAPFGSTEYVGVGITNPSTKLHVNGTITCDDLNSTSDINLKDNIRNIENPVSIVQNIRGVKFDWKKNQKPSLGVIAQEIEEVLPELVNETEDHKTVNYNGIIGLLIEAVKSQQEEIDELKRKLG